MSERDSYEAGRPSWVDISTTDIDGAVDFYGQLMGWEAVAAGGEENMGYRIFTKNGKSVAGVGPLPEGALGPMWKTYVATDDVDATAAAVKRAGGSVIVEPMDVMTAGRMAYFTDPSGAPIGAWQAGDHKGAQLVNEPGGLIWSELRTRDTASSQSFYSDVFGWGATPFEGMDRYTVWTLGGSDAQENGIGGMLDMREMFPAEVPPHWDSVFAVEDVDAAAAKAKELGGSVTVEPMDMAVGRFAGLMDPAGGVFSVITPSW